MDSKEFITKAHYPLTPRFQTHSCHSCGTDILVDINRTAPRNYCVLCAWAKIGEVK